MSNSSSPPILLHHFAVVATLFHKQRHVQDSSTSGHINNGTLDAFRRMLDTAIAPAEVLSFTSRTLTNDERPGVVEVVFSADTAKFGLQHLEQLRRSERVKELEKEQSLEIVFQKYDVHYNHKRLAVFDMDSTLIQQEVIDEIAATLGPDFQAKVSAITERAMNGELDFTASLRERCRLLRGVSSDVWEVLKPRITKTPGVVELIRSLKRLGFKTAVLSGGFTPLAGWLAADLGLDYFHANHLTVSEDGKTLTGEVEGDIVHAEQKRLLLQDIASRNGVSREQVIAVGDGANDLLMLHAAGLGVAFNAKEKVQKEAPSRLNSNSMLDLMYIMGFTSKDIRDLLNP